MATPLWKLPRSMKWSQGFVCRRDPRYFDFRRQAVIDLTAGKRRALGTDLQNTIVKRPTWIYQKVADMSLNWSAGTYVEVEETNAQYVKVGGVGAGSWTLYLKWFQTKAEMDASLAYDDGVYAIPENDPTLSYRNIYVKSGASGSGSWGAATAATNWQTLGGKDAIRWDGQSSWDLPPVQLFQGVHVIILKPKFAGSNGSTVPMMGAEAGSTYRQLVFTRSSGPAYRVAWGNQSAGALRQDVTGLSDNTAIILTMAVVQATRYNHTRKNDGSNIDGGPVTGTTGHLLAGSAATIDYGRPPQIRCGGGSTSQYVDVAEYHVFGDPLLLTPQRSYLDTTITDWKTEYSIS